MCLASMNMTNDKATDGHPVRTTEGYSRLNAALEGDAQKLAMWDEMVDEFESYLRIGDGVSASHYERIIDLLERARAIK